MKPALEIRSEVERMLSEGASDSLLIERFREWRRAGATQIEVQSVLETMRNDAGDDATEDRILNLLDYVDGWCRRENTIWE